ncbi:unnamed protein product [Orchesella dallaii]|uniref:Uncharacterized protein n=1 Tax=Orchesella dallaii TaxID=48710 RepID=A0ABP1R2D4_9HEXA
MNKVAILLLGLLFVSAHAVPASEDEVSESEKKTFQETVSIEDMEGAHVNAVTPLKSIFLPSMARNACWICGYPVRDLDQLITVFFMNFN